MKTIDTRDYLKILKKNGYVRVRSGKGSHSIYSNGINSFPVSKIVNPVIALSMIKKYELVV